MSEASKPTSVLVSVRDQIQEALDQAEARLNSPERYSKDPEADMQLAEQQEGYVHGLYDALQIVRGTERGL